MQLNKTFKKMRFGLRQRTNIKAGGFGGDCGPCVNNQQYCTDARGRVTVKYCGNGSSEAPDVRDDGIIIQIP